MNTKHTPGEWILKPDNSIQCGAALIAQICSANNNDIEATANAKLIAMSPKMYETLDETSNRIALLIDLFEIPEEAVAMLRGEIDNILETIKKATE